MKTTNTGKKSTNKAQSTPEAKFNRRREWRLELPLKITVDGHLPNGEAFSESTQLQNISSEGAYFYLDAKVTIGTELNLIIELPTSLTEGKSLKLCLGGETVRLEKRTKKGKIQGVAIRFHKEFKDEEFKFISEA